MRFIIYGAGGIGSTIGGHLFRTGHDVVLVATPKHVEAIEKGGLRLVTPDATHVLPVPAVKEARDLAPFRGDDLVLLTAKGQHTVKCCGQLRAAGAPRTLPIACAQNGTLNESLAQRVFDKVYGVLLVVPAIFIDPGEVINPISGNSGLIEAGLYPCGEDELCHTLVTALRQAGFASHVNNRIMSIKRAKHFNNLHNALRAITDDKGDSEPFMAEVQREAQQVWEAAGMERESREAFSQRVQVNRGVDRMPAGYENPRYGSNSSWQSLARGVGNIETDWLNGEVVFLGGMLEIPTPYNALLQRIANEMAAKGNKPGKYTAEELMQMVR